MKKLSGSLMFVMLVLVLIDIAVLRELSRNEVHLAALEQKVTTLQAPKKGALAEAMAHCQRWFEKLSLAGEAGNWPLAKYYADKLQENAEEVIASKVVDGGQDISGLVKSTLLPALAELQKAAAAGDSAQFTVRNQALVSACNACHETTKRGFIKVGAR